MLTTAHQELLILGLVPKIRPFSYRLPGTVGQKEAPAAVEHALVNHF